MQYKIKNKKLGKALKKAERAEGYLIMITRFSNGKLDYNCFTEKFPREDFVPSLERHRKMLTNEMPPTTMKIIKTEAIPQEEKELPPEYRDGKNNQKVKTVRARMK